MNKRIEIYGAEHLAELTREKTVQFRGDVFLDHVRNGEYLCFEKHMGKNIIPTEGLNYLLNVGVGATSKEAAWYVGIFKGNYTPIATNTAANSLGGVAQFFNECQDADYDAATNRPAYTIAAASGGVITNSASKAQFTMKASLNIYGAFITSGQAKTATTGILLAAKRFDAAPRAVIATDLLYVSYQISAVSS